MTRNYYDFNGWGHDDRGAPARWEPGERPGPYGEVPGGASSDPSAEPGRRVTPPARKQGKRKPLSRGVPLFCLFLVLLLALAGGGLFLRGGLPDWPGSLAELWDRLDPRGRWEEWTDRPEESAIPWEGWDGYYDSGDEDNWRADLAGTTAPRAPTGTGVTMALLPAEGEPLTAQDIYEKVNPAVVQVRAFLRGGYSLGSGVVFTADGYIVTNAHVIAGARQISVVLPSGYLLPALLVGHDGSNDLAVLKVEAQGLTVAELGDSSALRVGDAAYAIGNPLGSELRGTMTSGIISAIDRSVSTEGGSMTLLQTTAALNSGNSGGALINEYGQVIGITNMKMMSDYETIEGLGFAIPTNVIKPVCDQLIATGEYLGAPMLGITVTTLVDDDDNPQGVEVLQVVPASDAWNKGIRPGDRILTANGQSLLATQDLLDIKAPLAIGDTLLLELETDGRQWSAEIELVGSNSLYG